MYVVRVRRDGNIGTSEPCRICKYFLDLADVRVVYYTTNEGWEQLNWDESGPLPQKIRVG
tara:strand:- start:1764 stop:1943 length:180 start_codon:yes stop_codon:yes gene_type:complete